MLNDILVAENDCEEDHEMISTEDFLYEIGQVNERIRNSNEESMSRGPPNYRKGPPHPLHPK